MRSQKARTHRDTAIKAMSLVYYVMRFFFCVYYLGELIHAR